MLFVKHSIGMIPDIYLIADPFSWIKTSDNNLNLFIGSFSPLMNNLTVFWTDAMQHDAVGCPVVRIGFPFSPDTDTVGSDFLFQS